MESTSVTIATIKRQTLTTKLAQTDITTMDLITGKLGKIYSNKTEEEKTKLRSELSLKLKEQCVVFSIYTIEKNELQLSKKDRLSSLIDENQIEIYSNSLYFDNLRYLNELTDLELHYLTLLYSDFTFAIDNVITERIINDSLKKKFEIINLTNYAIRMKVPKDEKVVKKTKKTKKSKKQSNSDSEKELDQRFDYYTGDRKLFFIQMLYSAGNIKINENLFPINEQNEYILKLVVHMNKLRLRFINDPILFLMTYNYPIIFRNKQNTLMSIPELLNDRLFETRKEIEEDQTLLGDAGIKLFVSIMNKLFKSAISRQKKLNYPTKFVHYVRFWVRMYPKALTLLSDYITRVFPKPMKEIESSITLIFYALCDIRIDQLDKQTQGMIKTKDLMTFITERNIKTNTNIKQLDELVNKKQRCILDELFDEDIGYDDLKLIMYQEYIKDKPELNVSIQQKFIDVVTTDDDSSVAGSESKIKDQESGETLHLDEPLSQSNINESVNSARLLLNDTPEVSDASDDEEEEDMNILLEQCHEAGRKKAAEIKAMREGIRSTSSKSSIVMDVPLITTSSEMELCLNDINAATEALIKSKSDQDEVDDDKQNVDDDKQNADDDKQNVDDDKQNVEITKLTSDESDSESEDDDDVDPDSTDLYKIDKLLKESKVNDHDFKNDVENEQNTSDSMVLDTCDTKSDVSSSHENARELKYTQLMTANHDGSCFWSSIFIVKTGNRDDDATTKMMHEVWEMFNNDEQFYYDVQIMAQANGLPYHLKEGEELERVRKTLLEKAYTEQDLYPLASVYFKSNIHVIDTVRKNVRFDINGTYDNVIWILNRNLSSYEPIINVENADTFSYVSYAGTSVLVEPTIDQLIPKPQRNIIDSADLEKKNDIEKEESTEVEILESEKIIPESASEESSDEESNISLISQEIQHDQIKKKDWTIEPVELVLTETMINDVKILTPSISNSNHATISPGQIQQIMDCSLNTVKAVELIMEKLTDHDLNRLTYEDNVKSLNRKIQQQEEKHVSYVKEMDAKLLDIQERLKIDLNIRDEKLDDIEKEKESLRMKNNDLTEQYELEKNKVVTYELQITELSSQVNELKEQISVLQNQLLNEDRITNDTNSEAIVKWVKPSSFEKYILTNEEQEYINRVKHAVSNYCDGSVTNTNYDSAIEDVHHIANGVQNAVLNDKPFSIIYSNHIITPFNDHLGNYVVLKKKCSCGNVKHIIDWLQLKYIPISDGVIQNEMICQCMVKPASLKDMIIVGEQKQYLRDIINEVIDVYA